jgi:broad specificity phosphatase PhoE
MLPPRRSGALGNSTVDGLSKDNPAPQFDYADAAQLGTCGDKIVLIMVGLPGRGKTFISRKIMRYLRFFHNAQVKVFNNGEYRRRHFGQKDGGKADEMQDADFFSTSNEEGKRLREQFAQEAMDDLKEWLRSGMDQGVVGIYDATNTTRERRQWTTKQLLDDCVESSSKIIFIESVVDDDTIVEGNMQAKIEKSDDYKDIAAGKARDDFAKRVVEYKKVYETLGAHAEDQKLSYIKLVDAGRQVVVNRIHGYLPGRIVQFTMNLHTIPRTIYFSRHGQSVYNTKGKIGGDSTLSEGGEQYARAFAQWVHTHIQQDHPHARLWTSSLRRTIDTAKHITHSIESESGWVSMRPKVWRSLDELHAGVFDGMTYEEIQRADPIEFGLRQADKLNYRYPRGESYLDVIKRLEPVVHELERTRDPVVLVGHQGVIRILLAYFQGVERSESIYLKVPLNVVNAVKPHAFGSDIEVVQILKPRRSFAASLGRPRLHVIPSGDRFGPNSPVPERLPSVVEMDGDGWGGGGGTPGSAGGGASLGGSTPGSTPAGMRRQIGSFGSFARIQKEKQEEEEAATLAAAESGGATPVVTPRGGGAGAWQAQGGDGSSQSQYDLLCNQYNMPLGNNADEFNRERGESYCSHIDDDDPPSY